MDILEMKDRIAHIIRSKNLTAAEFALRLGIQPSNISHLLSGRNNPSLDFVKKLKETFPEYNLDWIVMGRGPITVSEPFSELSPLSKESDSVVSPEPDGDHTKGTLFGQPKLAEQQQEQTILQQNPFLQKIILVYSDNTFEEIIHR
ncbi:MAG: helix-turn-helix transcriptional regulator [Bacteroidales bacterium]|nr:helix-turn-helix transcriptional regulator [Bacteroidales bacterium]